MKRIIEELLFQMLTTKLMGLIHLLIEWLNTAPWQVWCA